VLAIAHRRELIGQLVDRLAEHGVEAGVIMSGHVRRDMPVMVASIQTLVRRELPPAKIVLIDECHHARAATYERVLAKYPEAIVLGLTATPWRLDGRGLADMFEAAVVVATPAELVNQGYLCKATGHCYVTPDFGEVATKGGDYDAAGLSAVYSQDRILGDIVDRWHEHAYGRRTILFASSIENSEDMCTRFRARGIRAEHIDYRTPPGERRDIIARVRSGETTIIANVGILGEGVDVPALECAILARPTKSVAVYLQQVGRVLRPHPGKSHAIIHDHSGSIAMHGFWDDHRDYSLTLTKEPNPNAEAPVRICPACRRACPGGTLICPDCGYVWPRVNLETQDDSHKELTLEEMRALAKAKPDRDQLLLRLTPIAKRLGHKPGWVLHQIAEQLGEFAFPRTWWAANVTGTKGNFRWK
jgi:superfamily II DNA or RNA helicase